MVRPMKSMKTKLGLRSSGPLSNPIWVCPRLKFSIVTVSCTIEKSCHYLIARNSAASTAGCRVLEFRDVRNMFAEAKPASRNSSRNAPASLAPAIHENQFALPV